MERENKQKINCNVYDCKHCNCEMEVCKLPAINVASYGKGFEKTSTICDSYKKR